MTSAKSSLLSKHLQILDSDFNVTAPELKDITTSFDDAPLRPLNLAPRVSVRERFFRKFEMKWMFAALVPLSVASFVLTLTPQPKLDEIGELRIKGAARTWVYKFREGKSEIWDEQPSFVSGNRFRAEVLSPIDAKAYWFVANGEGDILSDDGQLENDSMPLVANKRKAFDGSFELDGDSEQEKLVVALCPPGTVLKPETLDTPEWTSAIGKSAPETVLNSCLVKTYSLRK